METGDKNHGDFHCTQMSLMMSMRYIFGNDWKFGNDVIFLRWIDFRVIMHDMQALIKKEISPSRMRKYYSREILFCGVLRCHVSQNIVAITFGNLRLNRFTLFYYLIDRFSQLLRCEVVFHFINTWDIKYPLSCNFYMRTCIKFAFANKI